ARLDLCQGCHKRFTGCPRVARAGGERTRQSPCQAALRRPSATRVPRRRAPGRFRQCPERVEPVPDLRTEQGCLDAEALPRTPRELISPTGTRLGHGLIAAPAHATPHDRRALASAFRPRGWRLGRSGATASKPHAAVAILRRAAQRIRLLSRRAHI